MSHWTYVHLSLEYHSKEKKPETSGMPTGSECGPKTVFSKLGQNRLITIIGGLRDYTTPEDFKDYTEKLFKDMLTGSGILKIRTQVPNKGMRLDIYRWGEDYDLPGNYLEDKWFLVFSKYESEM